jgi:hypothetical protein
LQGSAGELAWQFQLNEAKGEERPGVGGKLTVCPEGCGYSSIQDAIDHAMPGSTIEVKEGTYHENVNVTKPLKLMG